MSSEELLQLPTASEPLPSQLQQSPPPREEPPEATAGIASGEETGSPTPALVLAMQGTALNQYRNSFLLLGIKPQ